MAIDPGTAIAAGGQIIGAIGGKKKKSGNSTSSAISKLLEAAAKRALNDDPSRRIDQSVDAAMLDTKFYAERALSNVFGKFAQQGSMGYLPDTARNSVLRGTLEDVYRPTTLWAAQAKAGAFDQWIQNAMRVVGSAAAGRGEQQPSQNGFDWATGSQVFGRLLGDAFKRGGK
jgi:hypothetical protein